MACAFQVVLYRFSTSNHNVTIFIYRPTKLYYIVSLHQTTTKLGMMIYQVLLYYIVSLHQTTTNDVFYTCGMRLYYIVSLHQTTTYPICKIYIHSCIISFLYIKPQLPSAYSNNSVGCIISFLYIKPQRYDIYLSPNKGCIISFLYIKPQLSVYFFFFR